MIILPAIDLKDGMAVRLYQGDFATVQKVANDPLETAKRFERDHAQWIHMVDLDGALKGHPVNMEIISTVAFKTNLYVEVGGGIRTMETIDDYINIGVKRVILGSVALSDPDLVKRAVDKYEDMIAVGIDARKGIVKGGGWLEDSDVNFLDLAEEMERAGVRTVIYTDIEKDGTLSGPNNDDLDKLNQHLDANIIASGGVHNIDDIGTLASLGLYGAICGKAIYTGDLDLTEAIKLGGNYR